MRAHGERLASALKDVARARERERELDRLVLEKDYVFPSNPSLLPRAEATGNCEIRAQCLAQRVLLDDSGRVVRLEEKPAQPRTNLAVPGLYVYDGNVSTYARELVPSHRGELEITDLNRRYMDEGTLRAVPLGRGIAWLDSGTHESLLESSNFIATIEKRQGLKIACLEEIALRRGFIDHEQLEATLASMPNSPYRSYVERIAHEISPPVPVG